MAQLKLGTTIAGNTAWHSGNDGTGSGLDADLLDGLDSLHYLNYNNLTNKPTVWPITGTDGQMVYINDGVATSSPLVFYDDVNQRLGIGTNTPSTTLDVNGAITFASDGAGSNWLKWERLASNNWQLTSNGVGQVLQLAGNLLTIPQDVTIKRGGLDIERSSLSASPALGITETWNDSAITFTAIKTSITDTASAAGSLLMDLQVGGASRFNIDKNGWLYGPNNEFRINTFSTNNFSVFIANSRSFSVRNSEVRLANLPISWTGTVDANNVTDLTILREAANTLAQRNGITAQTSRVYNTYTDASNYERAKIGWNTNVLEIGTEKAGTGATRNINLIGGAVGIGIAAPATSLDIQGGYGNGLRIRGPVVDNNWYGGIQLTNSSGAAAGATISASTGGLFFAYNGTEYARIGATGSVGIGTTAPTGRAEIADSGAVNSRLLYLNSSTGLAGGQTGPLYGLYSDVVGNNNATSAYGGYLYGNAPSGSSYGIYGEALQASSTRDGIGVVGKSITNSASTNHRSDRGLGLGPVAGVYAITGTTGTSLVAQTTALHALNTTVYGAESYGAWIETVAGPTSIVPLKVVHAGTEIFRVGSNGDVLVNGITVGRGTAAIATNTAVGVTALNANTTGNSNTAVGHEALFSNTTGTANTATGLSALRANLGGTANTATGRNALLANTTGLGNTATGLGALVANTTGSYNTCIGHDSGQALTTGSNNTIIGRATGTAGLADTVIIAAGITERMRIDSSGNLGIATAVPTQRLDVAGNTTLRNGTTATNLTVHNTYTDASNYEHGKFGWNANVLEIGTVAAGTGTLRNINLIGGNVGIGTSTPSARFEVVANSSIATSTGISIRNLASTNNYRFELGVGYPGYYDGAALFKYAEVLAGYISSGGQWNMLTDVAIGSNKRFTSLANGSSALNLYDASGNTNLSSLNSLILGSGSGTERVRITTNGDVGINTTTPSAKLDVAGDIEVNSNVNLNSEATTLATVTKTQIASFPVASFRSGKLIVQAYDSVTGEVQISELLVAHNGTTASATEYGVVFTGTSSIVIYDVDISAGNVRLLATRTTANSTQYKTSETLMIA